MLGIMKSILNLLIISLNCLSANECYHNKYKLSDIMVDNKEEKCLDKETLENNTIFLAFFCIKSFFFPFQKLFQKVLLLRKKNDKSRLLSNVV